MGFIRPSNFSINTSILFVKKPNNNLQLYVDYWGLNNLNIKNWYFLPFLSKSLNWLGWARILLNYHQMKIWKGDEWKTVFKIRNSHFDYQIIFLSYLTLQPTSRAELIRSWSRNLIFLLLYIWMTFWFISIKQVILISFCESLNN